MKCSHRSKVINIVLGVVLFVVVNISVSLYRQSCPERSVLPASEFPPQESLIHFKEAGATAQWARKYDANCQTCHTAFPRLNYFGELFKRNGYQMPTTKDGDETKKAIGNHLFIDNLGNLFGLRINITPAKVETDGLVTNGRRTTRFSVGNSQWVQLFTAGTIFKNTSIFIETEVADSSIHNNWFTLGFHNLIKTPLLNIRVGKLDPIENLSQSGRLRMIPSVSVAALSNFRSAGAYNATAQAATLAGAGVTAANSTHDDQTTINGAQPSIEIYGYKGPFLYSVGVSNGKNLVDVNKFKNFFGTLRLDMEDGPLAGSNISGSGYLGWDTSNNTRSRQTDKFWRTVGSANLRWSKLDVIGAFVYGRDDNWDLLTNLVQKSKGFSGQIGYLFDPQWFAALQYDWLSGTDRSQNFNKISPAITFMPRENMRLDLVGRIALQNTPSINRKQHEVYLNIRSMF